MFSRLKTAKHYNDSHILKIEWTSPRDLELTIGLDTWQNQSGVETAVLRFVNVRNRPEIEAALKKIAESRGHDQWIAEIHGFGRYGKTPEGRTRYYVGTTPEPSLIIDCSSYVEI